MNPLTTLAVLLLASAYGYGQILHEVIPRSEWGAAPVKQGKEAQYQEQSESEIRHISIHHTDSRSTHPRWDEKKLLQFIQDFHQNGKSRGAPNLYRDIAYHYIVSESGNIFAGRALNRAPASGTHYLSEEELVGATYENGSVRPKGNVPSDIPGFTPGHITVSFRHGRASDGSEDGELLSEKAMENAATLIAELLIKYKLTPKDVRAHREIASGQSNCPGDAIYQWLRGEAMNFDGEGVGMKRISSEYLRLKSR